MLEELRKMAAEIEATEGAGDPQPIFEVILDSGARLVPAMVGADADRAGRLDRKSVSNFAPQA